VKRLVLSRAVLLIGFFVVGQSFVPTAEGTVSAASMAEELSIMATVANATASKTGKVGDANATDSSKEARGPGRSFEGVGDVNMTGVDANAAVEPNEEDPHVKMLKDIEKAFENLKRGSQREGREWMRLKGEEGMDLVKAVQKQLLDELNVLREIAVEEDAVKTTAAIDKLLADRQERFEKVLKRMEAEDEKLQRKELREKHRRNEWRERRSRDLSLP
jgi:hypothetical protein